MHTHCTVWAPYNNTLSLWICRHFIDALCNNSIQLSLAPALPFCTKAQTCHLVYIHRECVYQDIHCSYTCTPGDIHLVCNIYMYISQPVRSVYTHPPCQRSSSEGIARGIYQQYCTPAYTCTYTFYRTHHYISAASLPLSLLIHIFRFLHTDMGNMYIRELHIEYFTHIHTCIYTVSYIAHP